jgi:hypothetical protein
MSIDNVTDVSPRAQFTAAALQTVFDFDFPIFQDADLKVYVEDSLRSDYVVLGAGDDTGGSITFDAPLVGGEIVTILRDTVIERVTDFQQNGPFFATAVNDEFDKGTVIMQELSARIDRSVHLAPTDPVSSLELAPVETRKGKYLFFNAVTGAIEYALNVVTTTLSQSVIGQLLNPREASEGLLTIVNYWYRPWDMRRYFGGATTDPSNAVVQAVFEQAIAQQVSEVTMPGKWTFAAPVYFDNCYGMRVTGGELHAHASWPVVADWKARDAFFRIGTNSAGGMINLDFRFLKARSGRKATGFLIGDGSYGCGASTFEISDCRDMNMVGEIRAPIWPTASNVFRGKWLQDCNAGVRINNVLYNAESTVLDYQFCNHNDYGGYLLYDGTQYFRVRGGLDYNGEFCTELRVAGFSSFAAGNIVTGGTTGTTGEVVATYIHQNANYILVKEAGKLADGATAFTTEAITSGAASTTIAGTRVSNQAGSNFWFDIVVSLPLADARSGGSVDCDYLGGIVGHTLHTCSIFRKNSNDSIVAEIGGFAPVHSGTILTFFDRVLNTTLADFTSSFAAFYRDLYLGANGGNYRIYNQETAVPLTTAVASTIFTMPALTNGSQWQFKCSQADDNALRAGGTVTVTNAGAVAYDSDFATGLTISVSGANVQALHGTGGVKTIRATLVRLR